jgi:hypothetical protein
MDLVNKLLVNIPKDEHGFEDLDKFWIAAGKYFLFFVILD